MKRILCCLAVALCFSVPAKAQEEKFFLGADGVTVEKRVASLEKRVADLEKKLSGPKTIAESGPGTIGSSPKTFPLSPVAPKIKFQVCVNGRCANGECDSLDQVPLGAKILNASVLKNCGSYACPANGGKGGCTCGTDCDCVNISPQMATGASVSSGETTGRRRLFGGRLRGTRACASCGQ